MPSSQDLAAQVLAALPQTQCTRCGYVDCAAYADAIAVGEAGINQCPPGGAEGIARLAAITGQPPVPLNPLFGTEAPRGVAVIDEAWCIGCTLCIKACPTDAIVGSNKLMHTVIEPCCTGCELCLPVCPVDCIQMVTVTAPRTGWAAWSEAEAQQAQKRYSFHSNKAMKDKSKAAEKSEKKAADKLANLHTLTRGDSAAEFDRKRSIIEAALAKARERREASSKAS